MPTHTTTQTKNQENYLYQKSYQILRKPLFPLLFNVALVLCIAGSSLSLNYPGSDYWEFRPSIFGILYLAVAAFFSSNGTVNLTQIAKFHKIMRPVLFFLPVSIFSYFIFSKNAVISTATIKAHINILLYFPACFGIYRFSTIDRILKTYILTLKCICTFVILEQFVWITLSLDLTSIFEGILYGQAFRGEDGWLKRVHGWYREPAHFAQFASLGAILGLLTIGKPIEAKVLGVASNFWRLVILFSVFMTVSLTGYSALVIPLLLLLKNRKFWLTSLVFIVGIGIAITSSSTLMTRLEALTNFNEILNKNLSVYALYSNLSASLESLIDYPLGRGIGNHILAHADWLTQHPEIRNLVHAHLNAEDGGSIIIRSVSELGIFAIVLWMIFLWKLIRSLGKKEFLPPSLNAFAILERGSLLAFLCYSMRQGSYSIFDGWLFLLLAFMARSEIRRNQVLKAPPHNSAANPRTSALLTIKSSPKLKNQSI